MFILLRLCLVVAWFFSLAGLPVHADGMSSARWFRLSNGMQFCIVSIPGYSQTVLDTWFGVGSRNESADVNGISHFLEHVMFKTEEGVLSIDVQVESKGGMTNAATSKDFTHYYYVVPSTQESDMLKLHLNMIFKPPFPPAEVKREQPVVQEEIYRAINAPFRILFDAIYADLYQVSPHIAQTVLGSPSQIATFDAPVIKKYYAAQYHPSRSYVFIATPATDISMLLKAVEEASGQKIQSMEAPGTSSTRKLANSFKSGTASAKINWATASEKGTWRVSLAPSVPMPTVLWAFPEPDAGVATTKELIAYQVYLHLLAEGQDSQLNQAVVEQASQPAYSVGASWIRHAFEGFSFLYIMNEAESMPIAIQRLRLALLDRSWLTQSRFERAKKEIQLALATQKTQPSDYISSLGESVVKGQLREFNEQDNIIQTLTLADVLTARDKTIARMQRATVPFVLLPKQLEQQANALTKEWAEYQTLVGATASGVVGVKSPEEPVSLDSAQQAEPMSVYGIARKYLASSQLIDAVWHVPVYEFSVKEHAALQLLDDLWLVKPHAGNRLAPSDYLKDLGVRLEFTYDSDVVSIRTETMVNNAGAMVQAQHALLERGGALVFDDSAFEVARTNAIKSVQMLETNPQGLMQAHALKLMGQHLPVGLQLEEKVAMFKSLQPADIRNVWLKLWNKTPRALALAGPESALRFLEQGMEMNGLIKPEILIKQPFGLKNALPPFASPGFKRVVKQDQATTWFMWAWDLPPTQHADMPALQLIQSYLGQGMSARLFQEVREKNSLAYEVAAILNPGKQRSILSWYAGVKPENIVKARQVYQQLLIELTQAPLTEAQLNAVKDKRIGRFKMSLNTPAEWATLQGRILALGLPADYLTTYAERINAVSPKIFQDVAVRYLGTTPDLELILGNPTLEMPFTPVAQPNTSEVKPDKSTPVHKAETEGALE